MLSHIELGMFYYHSFSSRALRPQKQSMCGWMWLLQITQSKLKTTNRSLHFGTFKVSLLKGIFGPLRKTTPERFQKYLLSGLCFLPCEGLIVIHVVSLGLSHFAISAFGEILFLKLVNFGKGSFFPLYIFYKEVRRKKSLLKPPGSLMKMQTSMLNLS